ncbi:MAG TPA: hypothetical protein V6D10_14500 [Trichocoleus sp.]|jgi:hypothetical protein
MLDSLFEFSRTHCISICAVLVPVNLIATLQTMLLVWFRRPIAQVGLMAATSSLYATLLILHVITWLVIGVVMLPTYILFALGCFCISTNLLCLVLSWQRTFKPLRWLDRRESYTIAWFLRWVGMV